MEVFVYEGKNRDDVLAKALEDLKVQENEVLFKEEKTKGKLFKAETFKFTIIKLTDIQE